MKSSESKTTTTQQPTSQTEAASPFFAKEQEQDRSFFGDTLEPPTPFFSQVGLQTKLKVGQPNDSYEKEADSVADQVVNQLNNNSTPATTALESSNGTHNPTSTQTISTKVETSPNELLQKEEISAEEDQTDIQRKPIFESGGDPPEENTLQTKSDTESPTPTPDLENRLSASKGKGEPLAKDTQTSMESAFGADFSEVRVHTGSDAVHMNQELGSQAFAHKSDIYFAKVKYDTASSEGQHLLAHELTHTVQQGASVRTKPAISSGPEQIQGLGIQTIRNEIGDFADRYLPAYSLLSVGIGYDLIRGRSVSPTRANIIKGVFSLINPWGTLLREKLEEHGIINDAFNWIDTQLNELGLTRSAVSQAWDQFWAEKDFVRWDPIEYNFNLIKRRFGPFVRKIISFASRVGTKVFEMIKQAFLNLLAKAAKAMGGYDLLADLLGQDPITGEVRNASTADILRGILKLPVIQAIGGDKLLAKLEELNLINKAADWIDTQWALLKGAFTNLLGIADKFLQLFSWETLRAPLKLLNEIKDEVFGFIGKVISFFKNLATTALKIIKEVMIYLLKTFVNENTYGFDLVKVLLGKDPFTGEKYPRTPKNIIKAFIKLLPGGEEIYNRFEETGAIDRMLAWINNAVSEFVAILLGLKDAFVNLWKTSSIEDLFDPIGFFLKIVDLFKAPVIRLVAFVKMVIQKIIEVMLDIMKFPIEIGRKIIQNAMKAFNDIKKDPIKFFLNLLGAVKKGFADFFSNIGKHLLNGVTGWLFGQLAKTGIKMPKDLSLGSILDLVFQVLGLTMENLWARLAKKIGQDKVDKIRGAIDKLVGVWTFIQDVVKNGLSAIWKYLKEKISGLWDMIINSAKEWIITKIIEKVVTKLLSMLDPTGIMAVVNGFMAFFNAVQSFIEKFKELLAIVATFVEGLAEIARGTIAKGAGFLENALSKALPVAISFLANQVGLGNVGDKIRELIQKVQGYIGQGIDWLIDKAMKGMQSIMNIFTGKKGGDGTSTAGDDPEATAEQTNQNAGLQAIDNLANQELDEGEVTEDEAEGIKNKVNQDHSATINISTVSDGGETWDFEYIQRAKKKVPKTVDELSSDSLIKEIEKLENDVYELSQKNEDNEALDQLFLKVSELRKTLKSPPTPLSQNDLQAFSGELKELYEEYENVKKGLVHASKIVQFNNGKFQLIGKYQSGAKIRSSLYGGSYRANVKKWKEDRLNTDVGKTISGGYTGLRNPNNPNEYYYNGKYYDKTKSNEIPTIDHQNPPVVTDWNTKGNDEKQQYRLDKYNNISDLEIVPLFINSGSGGKLGSSENYNFEVTFNFRGPGEN